MLGAQRGYTNMRHSKLYVLVETILDEQNVRKYHYQYQLTILICHLTINILFTNASVFEIEQNLLAESTKFIKC